MAKKNLDKTMTIRLSSELLQRIEEEAKVQGISSSEYGLTLLKSALGIKSDPTSEDKNLALRVQQLETKLDALNEQAMGIDETSSPLEDLATNPAAVLHLQEKVKSLTQTLGEVSQIIQHLAYRLTALEAKNTPNESLAFPVPVPTVLENNPLYDKGLDASFLTTSKDISLSKVTTNEIQDPPSST
ncbi:MAG: hypothetical protein KME06_05145 [Kastovskya adunca ATA6-11-RM4]|jgi:hypothetical protein|nr:hypothetical protein [Kastovskya adunca ATA6-11-RM4]